MRVDRKFLVVLVPALFALAPFACGGDEEDDGDGAGGSGAAGATASSSTGISTVSSSSTGFASSSTGMANCAGLGDGISGATPDCGPCLESNCCAELEAWGGRDPMLPDDLQACASDSCADECIGGPGAEVGAPECTAGTATPSAGACVTVADLIECNPVTNEPCDTAGGEACDANSGGGFSCFAPPNDTEVCGTCSNSNGPFCIAGHTCVGDGGVSCAKFCCTDADCAPGTCFTEDNGTAVFPPAPGLGVCIEAGGGGAGGGGGGTGGGATGGGGAGGTGGA